MGLSNSQSCCVKNMRIVRSSNNLELSITVFCDEIFLDYSEHKENGASG